MLQAARALGVDIDSVCGGRAICGRCQITIGEGEFAKHAISSGAEHLSELLCGRTDAMRKSAGSSPAGGFPARRMLLGDVVVDVPPESQVHKQVVRKRAEARVIEINPIVRLHYIEVEEPDMHKPSSDLERVYRALAEQWNVEGLSSNFDVLRGLQKTLRQGEWKITVAVHSRLPGGGKEIIAVWPGYYEKAFGLAVDIGSTTIAAHLTDLASGEVTASAGIMNPQIRFGEDLMSRVSYVMMNPGGDREMTAAVREAINTLAGQVANEAGIALEDVLDIVLVGNPVMHHLFFGLDPVELGGAPFALATGLADHQAGARARHWTQRRSLCLCAALHRRPCRSGHGRRRAVGKPASVRRPHAGSRCRHQRRDRARLESSGCLPAPRQRVPLSKARKSPQANAPLPAPSSGCASRPKRSSRASR